MVDVVVCRNQSIVDTIDLQHSIYWSSKTVPEKAVFVKVPFLDAICGTNIDTMIDTFTYRYAMCIDV